MTDQQQTTPTTSAEFYATPGRHTDVRDHLVGAASVADVVRTVQGLLVYDLFAESLYGVGLSGEQRRTIHERNADAVLRDARLLDDRPLEQPRHPGDRVGGRCNTYTLVAVALFRAAGIPARARCGFATYFVPGWYEDHWVAEYWSAADGRWVMIDAQLDDTWRTALGIVETVPVEVGPDRFLTGEHAWRAWRNGELDADRCGLSSLSEHGAFWIAANLRLDIAALNKVEMLPWDLWGPGWEPSEEPSQDMLTMFDGIAELTVDPDRRFDELRDRYESDPSLRVNGTVFNAVLGEEQRV